jgi:hypothetical protein
MITNRAQSLLFAVGVTAFTAVTAVTVGCSDAAPVRLALDTDTLISSTGRTMVVPVNAIARDGAVMKHIRLTYATTSTVVQVWNDGRVECSRPGDAVVTIAVGALTTHVVVLCRPRLWLGLVPALWNDPLWVGEPPRDVSVVAYDSANSPVRLPRGTATARVRDDSVARIVGGRVFALSPGRTSVDLAFDGLLGDASIEVVERVVHDTLHLAGRQYQLWHLPPGYYELRLNTPVTRPNRPGLVLAAYGATCAHAPRDDGQHYFCTMKANASVIVQNSRPVGTGADLRGELTVFRLPLP